MNDPVRNPYIPVGSPDSGAGTTGDTSLSQAARTGQIITFAMIQGLLLMFAILLYLSNNDNPPEASSLRTAGLGIVTAVLSWFAAGVVTMLGRRQAAIRFRSANIKCQIPASDNAVLTPVAYKFVSGQQSATLVGQAILEGGAMINLVLMLIDRNVVVHLTLTLAAVIGIGILTPTSTRLRRSLQRATV